MSDIFKGDVKEDVSLRVEIPQQNSISPAVGVRWRVSEQGRRGGSGEGQEDRRDIIVEDDLMHSF